MSEKLPAQITIGQKYDPAMKIQSQPEADAYFEKCVEHTMSFGTDRAEAERIERINLGYYAGYCDRETQERVNRLFSTTHPVFGGSTPTPAQALQAGIDAAKKRAGEEM